MGQKCAYIVLGLIGVWALANPTPVRAANFFGLSAGVAVPSSSSAVFAFGLELGFGVGGPLQVEAFLQRYGVGLDVSSSVGTASVSNSNLMYGLGVVYTFTGTLQGFYGSLKTGLSKSSSQVTASSTSTGSSVSLSNDSSPIIFSPGLGYDIAVGRFSIGPCASYVFGFGDQAPSALFLMAVGKFIF